jgi:hypothetical protein
MGLIIGLLLLFGYWRLAKRYDPKSWWMICLLVALIVVWFALHPTIGVAFSLLLGYGKLAQLYNPMSWWMVLLFFLVMSVILFSFPYLFFMSLGTPEQ